MIPALLFWLFKKYAKPAFNNFMQRSANNRSQKRAVLSIILLLHTFLVQGQEKVYTYQIKRNGDQIGTMQFYQKKEGSDTFLKMDSKVKTRFIFEINVQTLDQSHFKNGTLIYSSVHRKVNGKEKESKETKLLHQDYQLLSGTKKTTSNSPINYNMMLLYCQEPINISQVYSDNYQQMLPIYKTAPNTYRINLPDGNYNSYYFQNGTCKKVEVHHTLYLITMELV